MLPSMAEIHKLRHFQQNLEKNRNTVLEKVSRVDESQQIKEIHKEINDSRKTLTKNVQNDIMYIIGALKNVKNVANKETIENSDLKGLKKKMITIQDNIQSLKQGSKVPLQTLKIEEAKLNEDIRALETKIRNWDEPSVQNAFIKLDKKAKTHQPLVTANSICQEAKDFMDFLIVSGGHENGWNLDDHNLFLRFRNKTKDVRKLVDALQSKLPDLSDGDIVEHERWYTTYLELRDKQKLAIQKWRNTKSNRETLGTVQDDNGREEKTKFTDLNDEKKRQLALWKETQREKQRLEHTIKKGEQLKKMIQAEEDKKKFEEVKAVVQDWRARKVAIIEAERTEQEELEKRERERRAAEANKLIKRYQVQDKMYIERKLQLTSPTNKPVGRALHLFKAKRDPDRLFRPTKTWLMRGFGNAKERKKFKIDVESIPKLGRPSWRKTV